MAVKIKPPGSSFPTTLPKFKVDPILPSGPGALWLVDATHVAEQWAAGVPANNAVIPNLVSYQANAINGALGVLPLAFQTDGLLTGVFGKVERSTKGGLHVILSRAANSDFLSHSSSKYYTRIVQDTSKSPWTAWGANIYGTTGADGSWHHSMYLSTWTRITRAQTTGANAYTPAEIARGASSGYKIKFQAETGGLVHYPNNVPQVQQTALGGAFNAVGATTAVIGTDPTSAADLLLNPFIGGHWPSWNFNTGVRENAPSFVFYRSYCEDLTVTGRSFAEVSAIDQALYTKHVLTAGGRYYGDTYTDPATIA